MWPTIYVTNQPQEEIVIDISGLTQAVQSQLGAIDWSGIPLEGIIGGAIASSLLDAIQGKVGEIPLSALAGAASGVIGQQLYQSLQSIAAPPWAAVSAGALSFLIGRKLLKWLLR